MSESDKLIGNDTLNSLSYSQFIDDINSGKIKRAVFRVKDYAHYKHCAIERRGLFPDSETLDWIEVKLTSDNSENYLFSKKFEERRVLFDMKRKGRYTLKRIWEKIEFISIEYAQ